MTSHRKYRIITDSVITGMNGLMDWKNRIGGTNGSKNMQMTQKLRKDKTPAWTLLIVLSATPYQ